MERIFKLKLVKSSIAIYLLVLLVACSDTNDMGTENNTNNKDNNAQISNDDILIEIEEAEKNVNIDDFQDEYPGYYIEYVKEPGFIGVYVSNYDPDNLLKLPDYQEVIGYGESFQFFEENKTVYSISILSDGGDSYYEVELDPETLEKLYEDSSGDWEPDIEIDDFIEGKLDMLRYILK